MRTCRKKLEEDEKGSYSVDGQAQNFGLKPLEKRQLMEKEIILRKQRKRNREAQEEPKIEGIRNRGRKTNYHV